MDNIIPINKNTYLEIPENKYSIIIGKNCSGKTVILNLYKNYFEEKNFNVIYFPTYRTLQVSKEEIQAFDVLRKLSNKPTIIEYLNEACDMKDDFALDNYIPGNTITCGYLQMINFLYTISYAIQKNKNNKPFILLIDNFELNLHVLMRYKFLNDLLSWVNIDKIIVTTYDLYNFNNTEYKCYQTGNLIKNY